MSFKADSKTQLGWVWIDGARDEARLAHTAALAEGAGENQAEAGWLAADQVLLSGAAVTLDLAALAKEAFGDAVTVALSGVRAMLLVSAAGSAGNLVVGGAASQPWLGPLGGTTDRITLPPGGALLLAAPRAGWPVDAAAHNLRLSAAGGDVTWSLALVGTTTPAGSSS